MRKKNRIISFLLILAMVFTFAVGNTSLKVSAAGQTIYTTKGEVTKIYASAFAQNTDDWAWMSIGDTYSLAYQDGTNLNAINSNDVLASSNATSNFGIQIADGNLAAGDSSAIKFHLGTVTIKAEGYADIVVNLNKDYSQSYLAETVSWGLTGNSTQILLNEYLPTDATEKANYLKKVTGVTADITLSEYEYTKAGTTEPTTPTGQAIYTTKGEVTKIYAGAFAQNTDDWTWMSIGDGANLVYQDGTNINAINSTDALASSNATANFGINISDGNLAAGDSSTIKFHLGTVTIKAEGYADVVINLNKDYSQSYLAETVSWGLTGNTTQILLNEYLPTDATAKADYLKKVTGVTADITLSEYQYTKATPTTPPVGETIYTTKGEVTKIYASAFAQNTDDWTWMNVGDTYSLVYQDVTNINAISAADALASSNATSNFGINIVDGNLAAKDGNKIKFHVGTITVKADGYDDLIVNLNKDYSEAYLASEASWGLTGNTTQILLNSYLPTDATAKANYLKKVTGVTADITLSEYTYIKAAPTDPTDPTDPVVVTPEEQIKMIPNLNIAKYDYQDNDAMKFVENMRLGWNLGNTFDAYNATWLKDELAYESVWCGAKTTKQLIDNVKAAGFNSVRIPVSWHNHVSGDNFTISEAWLNRVQEVVNYCIDNDMHVILNIHHDNDIDETDNAFFYPSSKYLETSKKYVTSIWSQLAQKFANYDDKLIFESLNEPRLIGHTNEWWIDPKNADVIDSIKSINELNQTFVNTVRATGGNNANRYLMTPGYCASADGALNENFKLPTDIASSVNKIIVSVHAYTPYDFALQGEGGIDTWSVDNQTSVSNMTGFMDKLYEKYTKLGTPVVIGEFGARDKEGNIKSRIEFASYYIAAARARGISCLWWDNNAFAGTGENFGLFERTTLENKYPGIVQGMVKYSVKNGTVIVTDPSESISKSLLVGRFDTSDPKAPKFAWSNSTIKANFKGTGIDVYLKSAGDNWFNVIVDGVVKAPINVSTSTLSPINLASGLADGNHTIELVKRTEASIGEVQFLGFTVTDGELLDPPAASSKRMMVIGDSISCGYGNEGASQNQTFTTKNENADLSYGAVTARTLGADFVNTSWSGKGLIRNYGGDTTAVMPQLYNQVLPYNSSLLWDTSKWTPQVVVINLGTNDFSIGVPDRGSFSRAYKALVVSIRNQYPNATIYCAVGPMLSGANLLSATDYIQRIANLQTTLGDKNIRFIQFPAQDGSTGFGEDWHPSVQTHANMAKQLTAQIKSDLGW